MNPSAGFLTVLLCALLVVVLPSGIVARALWRQGIAGRIAVMAFLMWLAALAAISFAGTGFPYDQEEVGILLFLAFWFVSLVAACALGLLLMVVRRALHARFKGAGEI